MSVLPPIRLSIEVDSEDQRIDLMHAIGAAVRRIKADDHTDPAEKYWDPAFTEQLVDHFHQAKLQALAGTPG